MELMRAENLYFSYRGGRVLNGVSLSAGKGEIVAVLGPNGSGKTTLLKILAGILRPDSGAVYLNGENLANFAPKRLAGEIAYVPQFHRTAFSYTVMDIVLMGRFARKSGFFRYSRLDREAAAAALERLGASGLAGKSYTEISGGERQLVLIARALAQGAGIVVMDEPDTSLDFGNRIMLLDRLVGLADEGSTFITSTHFPDHAMWVADRVVMLKNGDVIADGKPGEVMDARAVRRLYDAEISIAGVGKGLKTCVPVSAIRRGGRKNERDCK